MVSSLDRAKRALVALLKALATAYNAALTLTRESCDADVSRAYRQISRKVHPDRVEEEEEPRRGGEETTPSVRTTVPKVHQGDSISPKGGYLHDRRAMNQDEERRRGGGKEHGKDSVEKQGRNEGESRHSHTPVNPSVGEDTEKFVVGWGRGQGKGKRPVSG